MNRAERRRKNRELIKANKVNVVNARHMATDMACLLYTSPSPRD